MEISSNKNKPLQQNCNHNHHKNEEISMETQRSSHAYAQLSTVNISNDIRSNSTIDNIIIYDVEHLATFSTNGNHETNNKSVANIIDEDEDNSVARDLLGVGGKHKSITNNSHLSKLTTPKVALQRLFELEKLSGIWTQHMQIELRDGLMLIIDCETNSVVERFNKECVLKPEAFNHYNDIYNNIVVFVIKSPKQLSIGEESKLPGRRRKEETKESLQESDINYTNLDKVSSAGVEEEEEEEGELHIFQCVSHKAQQLVSDILEWKSCPSTNGEIMKQTSSSSEKTPLNDKRGSTITMSESKLTVGNSSSVEEKKNEQDKNHTSSSSNQASLSPSANGSSSASGSSNSKPVVVTVASSASAAENVPLVNVNVKETVQVFNQIAALREKSKPSSPTNHTRPASDTSASSAQSTPPASSSTSNNSASNSEPVRLPLSPGGQLYKQRSIRATLAPKFTSNPQSAATSGVGSASLAAAAATSLALEQQQQGKRLSATDRANSSNSAASSTSSSELNSNKPTASFLTSTQQNHNSLNQSAVMTRHQQAAGSNMQGATRDIMERSKQKVAGAHEQLSTSRSSQVQLAASHHKSSKSQTTSQQQQVVASSESSCSHTSSSSQSQLDQVTTNESYVSVLNHCFDDIEKFIIRLQQAVSATHELQVKRKILKRANQLTGAGSALNSKSGSANSPLTTSELASLSVRARGPNEDDYFEILSKFKLAFNLLAKLKGCIHEPNAPELVHFLFTPLAIIIEAARNATPPVDPTSVGIPYLNQDALDLLSNCCTSKESDMWMSLGPNWTQTIDMTLLNASRLPSSFQPIFSDGWAPIIGELELIGLIAPPSPIALEAATTTTTMNLNTSDQIDATQHIQYGENRRHLPYPPDDSSDYIDGGAPPLFAPFSPNEQPTYSKNNINLGSKSQAISSREYKKKTSTSHATLDTSRHQSDPMEPTIHRSMFVNHHQMNSIPYGYSNPELLDRSPEMHAPFRDHNSHSNRAVRRTKQSSRPPNYIIPTPNYADSSHYPSISMQHQRPLDDSSHLEIDLVAHRETASRGLHSDDYSELHDHYVDERGSSKLTRPGPSHQQYSRNNNEQIPNNGKNFTNGPGHKQLQHIARSSGNKSKQVASYYNQPSALPTFESDYLSESDQEAMLLDLGPIQTEWFYELQAKGALIVRVLFTRDANNDKELSVQRGEILEILDDTRKWWRARNIDQQVAHVPHTIVAIMQGYQTLDELLTNNPDNIGYEEPSLVTSHQRYSRRESQPMNYNKQQWTHEAEKRNSRSSGAFRYF